MYQKKKEEAASILKIASIYQFKDSKNIQKKKEKKKKRKERLITAASNCNINRKTIRK